MFWEFGMFRDFRFMAFKNLAFWGSILLVVAVAYLSASAAFAAPLGALTKPLLGHAPVPLENPLRTAPKAYKKFCLSNPDECRQGGAQVVAYDARLMQKLRKVNNKVNRGIKWTKDHGNVWKIGLGRGDCEDYALTKRSKLVKMGVPASSLRMAVVKDRKGRGHAVLVVRTSRGDLVLDNLTSRIKKRETTPYRWIGIASANPRRWLLL